MWTAEAIAAIVSVLVVYSALVALVVTLQNKVGVLEENDKKRASENKILYDALVEVQIVLGKIEERIKSKRERK